MFSRCGVAIVLALALSNRAFAQAVVGVGDEEPIFITQQPSETPPKSTLPEVVVEPRRPAGTAELPSSVSDTPAFQPYDLPGLYPNLAQQRYDGLNSATRSDRSVFDVPSLGSVVNQQQLQESQATDMVRAVQNEVGVLVQQTARGQASPFIRGLTGQQVLILVDGVRLNNSTFRFGPNQYFETIDPGQVDRVEVIRGPQSVLWGADAIGGVINVITKSANRDIGPYRGASFRETFSTADLGSYTRANVEGFGQSIGVFAGASYLNVNDVDIGGGGRQPFTSYDQYAGDVKVDWLVADGQVLTVALQHFEQQDVPRSDRFPPFVLGPPVNTPRPTYFDPQQRDLAYLRFDSLAENWAFDGVSATVNYSRQKEGSSELRAANQLDLGEFDVNSVGASLIFGKDLDWVGKLSYGVDYSYDDVDANKRRVNPLNPAAVPQVRPPQFPDDSLYDRFGAFANWDVPLTDKLDVITGVRYENANASGTPVINNQPVHFDLTYQDWITSVGLVYKCDNYVHLVGGVYEGYRPPNLDDLTADNTVQQNSQDIPSLHVQPEHSMTYEVGVKLNYPRLRVQLFEWWNDFEGYIGRRSVGGGNFVRDNFDSYLNGTELAAEYLLPDGWSVYGNFAYTYGQDLERNEPLSRIPPTQGYLGIRWRDEPTKAYCDLYTWLVARQDRYSPQNLTDARFPVGGTPGYATLNLRVGRTFCHGRCGAHHRVGLALENITDTKYRVLGSGVEGTGINAIMTWEVSF